jgi:hypothetical protein
VTRHDGRAQSLNQGKPVTTVEVAEMRRRHADGQSMNHIANAMGRSWTSVNRYVRGLSWVETRDPRRSPQEHLEYSRTRQRQRDHRRRLHEVERVPGISVTRRERWRRARQRRSFFRYKQPRVRLPKIRVVEPNIYERLPRPGIGSAARRHGSSSRSRINTTGSFTLAPRPERTGIRFMENPARAIPRKNEFPRKVVAIQ